MVSSCLLLPQGSTSFTSITPHQCWSSISIANWEQQNSHSPFTMQLKLQLLLITRKRGEISSGLRDKRVKGLRGWCGDSLFAKWSILLPSVIFHLKLKQKKFINFPPFCRGKQFAIYKLKWNFYHSLDVKPKGKATTHHCPQRIGFCHHRISTTRKTIRDFLRESVWVVCGGGEFNPHVKQLNTKTRHHKAAER